MSNYKTYLRRQPTYDEITGYIHFGQDRITYPDRSATFLRDSNYLGIYDEMGVQELEEQEQQIEKEKLKEIKIREVASDTGTSRALVELKSANTQTSIPTSSSSSQTNVNTTNSDVQTDPMIFDMTVDDDRDNYLHYLASQNSINKKVMKKQKAKIIRIVKRHLGTDVDTLPYMPNDDIADDADIETQGYVSDFDDDIDLDDAEMQRRIDKRKREAEDKKDKKIKLEKDEKKPIIKDEKKKIKKEGGRAVNTTIGLPSEDVDSEVEVTGTTWDRNTDIDYWKEQSANYIRQQLTAKFPQKRPEYAFFKKRAQYIRYITNLIRRGMYP